MQTTKTMPMRRQPCRDDGGGVAYYWVSIVRPIHGVRIARRVRASFVGVLQPFPMGYGPGN